MSFIFNILRMEKDVFRVTMSAVALISGGARLVGSWLGDRLARQLSVQTFARFVGGLVLLSGVALLLK